MNYKERSKILQIRISNLGLDALLTSKAIILYFQKKFTYLHFIVLY